MGNKTKKSDIEYPFEHGEVNNYNLDVVSIHPVTTKIQASLIILKNIFFNPEYKSSTTRY